MKLLVDGSLLQYGKAGVYCGIQSYLHDTKISPTFDCFDRAQPDIYIADPNFLTDTVIKNINERPALKVMFLAKEENLDVESEIRNKIGDIFKIKYVNGAADLIEYSKSEYMCKYKCDIISVDQNLPEDVLRMRFPKNIRFRIFSPEIVNSPYYCGFLSWDMRKHIYKSSTISISGGDAYCNSILCNCFPIAPQSEEDVFAALETDHADELEQMREQVLSKYNNFSVLANIFKEFGYKKEAKNILKKSEELK